MVIPKEMVQIFVPAYQQAPWIERTLQSIRAQTEPRMRVVVSDDGSRDGTFEIAQAFTDFEVIRQEANSGNLFLHWNRLLEQAEEEFVGIYHSDDLYEPTIVEEELAFLRKHPQVGVVLTAATVIDADDVPQWKVLAPSEISLPILDPNSVFQHLMRHGNSFLICPTAMFRREVFQELGVFDPQFRESADLDFWLRVLFSGKFQVGLINRPLLRLRYSVSQASSQYEAGRTESSDFYTVMDRYLDRAQFGPSDLQAYEALRKLDQLQRGLNHLAGGESVDLLRKANDWFRSHGDSLKNFGGVDRLKVVGVRSMMPMLQTRWGPRAARLLLKQTDPRRSWPLRTALKWKSWGDRP